MASERPLLFEQFTHFYKDLKAVTPVKIHDLYHDRIVFKDPVHELHGIDQLDHYFSHSLKNLPLCQFTFLDQLVTNEAAYIKWHMFYRHPKLGNDQLMLRGMTHILFDSKIYFHEDSYDLGSMIYDHLPVVGRITRVIKKKLANE
ncbi:MAG: nuclear transport factor 2 family protein [Cellvibrionales bacterium]|nr:nuclear transport factor 2 family protein [Cellvibrionales bacterium]